MLYVIIAVIAVVLLISIPFIRRIWTGNRLVTSLLTGEFDQSPVGQEFEAWFNERPARTEQRDLFVKFAVGMGSPSGIVADRLMTCIMKVWRGEGDAFGDTLVKELERLVVFDPPSTPEQAHLQQKALAQFAQFKARLRSLDSAGTSAMALDNVLSILCVDDEKNVLELMTEELHEAFKGVRIDVAQDGEEALFKCLRHVPTLLITGVAMPGMNGIELIKSLRARNIHIPVLVYSGGYSSDDIEKKGILLGENVWYLKKSADLRELIRLVNSLLELTK